MIITPVVSSLWLSYHLLERWGSHGHPLKPYYFDPFIIFDLFYQYQYALIVTNHSTRLYFIIAAIFKVRVWLNDSD